MSAMDAPKREWWTKEMGGQILAVCGNTQTADRIGNAWMEALRPGPNGPWNITILAAKGEALYVWTNRPWCASFEEERTMVECLKARWPDHPYDVDPKYNLFDATTWQPRWYERKPVPQAVLAALNGE